MKKTNTIILVLGIILFNSCGPSTSLSSNNNDSNKDTLNAGDYTLKFEEVCSYQTDNFYNSFYSLTDEDLKGMFGNYFNKKDSVLILKLANDKMIKYIDVLSDVDSFPIERIVQYEFKYYFKDIDYYFLHVGLWEGGYGLLVNRKNGLSKEINGVPYISKDHKKILCINSDESGYTVNGIELYTILNDSLRTEFMRPIDGWMPEDINWINENQFLLKKEHYQNETRELITEFKRVTIEKKTSP